MQVLSVNRGTELAIANGKRTGTSGIDKIPTTQRIAVRTMGLVGDVIVDTENHGGVDQAVYLYGTNDYAWWSKHLGKTLPPGTFGENLTISHLSSASYNIGDRFAIGDLLLEVTAPRIPCETLNARMNDAQFVRTFRTAERPGLYCRVLIPGFVQVGAAVLYLPVLQPIVTIIEAFRFYFERERHDLPTLRRFLAAPIDIRSRTELSIEYETLTRAQ